MRQPKFKTSTHLDEDVEQWLASVRSLPSVQLLPLTSDVAATAASLHDELRDPADSLIVATALRHAVPLVTADRRIQESHLVETIW